MNNHKSGSAVYPDHKKKIRGNSNWNGEPLPPSLISLLINTNLCLSVCSMFVFSEKMNQIATFCLLSSAFAVEHHHQPIECVDYYDADDDHKPDHYHEPESDDFIMI